MRATLMLALAGTALTLYSASTMAQSPAKRPRREVFEYAAYSAVPTLEAALLLSEEQDKKIDTAVRETVWATALSDLHKKGNDKSLPEADRKTAMDEFKSGRAKAAIEYKKRLAEILTGPQMALVEKLNGAAKAADQEVRAEYKSKFAGLEDDEKTKVTTEMADKTKAVAAEKIRALLTPEQAEALATAK